MNLKLKDYTVEIKDALTWGDREKIQATLMKGANINAKDSSGSDVGFNFDTTAMLESKYKALECAVVKIVDGDKEIEWTREWQDNLSIEDGDKLMNAVDSLSKKNSE